MSNEPEEQSPEVVDEAMATEGDGSPTEVEAVPDSTWKVADIDAWAEKFDLELPPKKADKLAFIEQYVAGVATEADEGADVAAEAEAITNLIRVINPGAVGEDVERLQQRLGVPATGKFDRWTQNAVRRFQAGIGQPQTGRVDSVTWRALGL